LFARHKLGARVQYLCVTDATPKLPRCDDGDAGFFGDSGCSRRSPCACERTGTATFVKEVIRASSAMSPSRKTSPFELICSNAGNGPIEQLVGLEHLSVYDALPAAASRLARLDLSALLRLRWLTIMFTTETVREDLDMRGFAPSGLGARWRWTAGGRSAHRRRRRDRRTRSGRDVTDRFPQLQPLAEALPAGAILDGELVCLDADSRPDFDAVQRGGLAGRRARSPRPPARRRRR
jgi:hypothetical protein